MLRSALCRATFPLACRKWEACSAPLVQKRWSQSLQTNNHIPYEHIFRRLFRKEVVTVLDRNPDILPRRRRYGIVVVKSGYVSEKSLLAMKNVLKRVYKSEGIIQCVDPDIQLRKKPAGKRMGGGVGKKIHKLAYVEKGTLVFEWDHPERLMAERAAKSAGHCLYQDCKMVVNPLPQLERLLEDEKMGKSHPVEEFAAAVKQKAEDAAKVTSDALAAHRMEAEATRRRRSATKS